jgi:hypothetical protein
LRFEPLAPDALEGSVSELEDSPSTALRFEIGGEVHRRVHFSLDRGGAVVRGVIDRLVVHERTVTVVGASGAMDSMLEAAEALFPGRDVQGFVVDANGEATETRRSPRRSPNDQLPLF